MDEDKASGASAAAMKPSQLPSFNVYISLFSSGGGSVAYQTKQEHLCTQQKQLKS